jgi:hypothetical protein
VAAPSFENARVLLENSPAESAAIPVSQNIRRLMVICDTEEVSLLGLRVVSHISEFVHCEK